MADPICAKCGCQILWVTVPDGSPDPTPADYMTWGHVDKKRDSMHQATPVLYRSEWR